MALKQILSEYQFISKTHILLNKHSLHGVNGNTIFQVSVDTFSCVYADSGYIVNDHFF